MDVAKAVPWGAVRVTGGWLRVREMTSWTAVMT